MMVIDVGENRDLVKRMSVVIQKIGRGFLMEVLEESYQDQCSIFCLIFEEWRMI